MYGASAVGRNDSRPFFDEITPLEMRCSTMGCFPFSFRLQARFEREIELRAQALYTLHEPPTAGSAEPTHALSNLPRLGAAQLTATPSTIPLQRSNSTDLLKFDSDLLTWQNTGPPAQREDRLQAARQLRNAKRMRETSVTLEYLDLNDLPECLAAMGNLIELQVRHSNLGRLQSLPPNLQNLRIVGAGLTHLPALPESLLKIALPNNRLNSLPKLPDRLQILSLNHNHFTELSALPVTG